MANIWLEFIIMALLIIVSGTYLSRYGDVIAERTGLGHAIIGVVLVAMATSLPELVTSSTAAILGSPNIAIGNAFGSNTFNLLILAIVDVMHNNKLPLSLSLNYSHVMTGSWGILLSAIAAISIVIANFTGFSISIFSVGIDSFIILITYFIAMFLIFRFEKKNPLDDNKKSEIPYLDISLKKASLGFFVCAAIIVYAGVRLAVTGDKIATLTGIDQTFIGSILVAAATSLPELVTAISAVRIKAYNMAAGNVLGSNIFNMSIIFFADLFYRDGAILSSVKMLHLITASIGIIMSSIFIIGLFYKSKKTVFGMGWDSIMVFGVYLLGFYLLFTLGISI
ncbi:MAG: sodium:calcium antiporter [Halanaerobiales bacterium]|nr:sodium:calcium antiporter [Halanaerobiales bacterium]